jgi:hypothetical protein
MKKVAIAIGLLALTTVGASAQWQLGKSQHEPCWSIANPVRCDGSYRPHNPVAFELFRRDPAAPQSFWYQR